MDSKSEDMQAIFSSLSEANKDIVLLVARSMQIAQGSAPACRNPSAAGAPDRRKKG